MRKILIILLAFLMLPALSAQDLSSILEAHYKAAAQEKMQKMESLITSGKSNYSMANFESAFKIYQSKPDKIRVEGDYQGATVIQTYNGEHAWNYAPTMGIPAPVEIKGKELKTLLSQFQFGSPLWNYADNGAEIELTESEDEDAVLLLYTGAEGDVKYFSIDRESKLITSVKTSQLMGGAETEILVKMEAYKNAKGIPIARRVVTSMNGQVVSTLDIEKVELNRKIDPLLFEKPIPSPSN